MEFVAEPMGLEQPLERQISPAKVNWPLKAEPIPMPVESVPITMPSNEKILEDADSRKEDNRD